MFKKAKTTFGFQSGRRGMPSSRKPVITKRAFRGTATKMAKKTSRKPIGKAKVVSSAKKPVTGKMKGSINSFRTAKKAPGKTKSVHMSRKPASGAKDNVDKRLGAYFSSIKTSY